MKACLLMLLLASFITGSSRMDVRTAPREPSSALASVKPEIEKLIATSGAEMVGLAVYDTETKQTLLINERANLHAASTMKLPVMMEIFRLADRKKLGLND